MTEDKEIMKLPALGGVVLGDPFPRLVRTLTANDLKRLEQWQLVYSLGAPQMRMFGVLVRNFKDLIEFTHVLQKARPGEVDPYIELNRFVLNYVASAGATLDHFDRVFKKRTRAVGRPHDVFERFRKDLEKSDDDFQFFCAFRNYALHVSLPVGNMQENNSLTKGRTVRITHRSAEFIADGRGDFKACRLLKKREEIELVPHLENVHKVLVGKFLSFVVECLKPGLDAAQQFYDELRIDVKIINPQLLPVIVTDHMSVGAKFEWTYNLVPENVFEDLGIHCNVRPTKGPT